MVLRKFFFGLQCGKLLSIFFEMSEIRFSIDWFGEEGGMFDLDIWFCVDILCWVELEVNSPHVDGNLIGLFIYLVRYRYMCI